MRVALFLKYIAYSIALYCGALQAQPYASNSVLTTGTWLKLGVTAEGVYRIDATWLQARGVNTATLDPRTLKVYGNGGGMLPQAIAAPRIDDLAENAVWVPGEADGVLSGSDALYFYADSPTQWRQRADGQWRHEKHLYADTVYYYLTYGGAAGKRIGTRPAGAGAGPVLAQSLQLWQQESDKENLLHSGRQWFGDRYESTLTRTYSFSTPGIAAGAPCTLVLNVAARSSAGSTFTVQVNGATVGVVSLGGVSLTSQEGNYARQQQAELTFAYPAGTSTLNVQLTYNKPPDGTGWLDWLELQGPQTLAVPAGAASYSYRTYAQAGGPAARVQLQVPAADWQLWEVSRPTDVRNQVVTISDNTYRYDARQDSARRWLAFSPALAVPPPFAVAQPNQNLHALGAADYVMIVEPGYAAAAEQLANFHRAAYGRTVHVVTPQAIYNEFSSGAADVTAIRDFVRMVHARSGGQLQYLLLFGQGSYDYKNIEVGGNGVPSYQSRESLLATASYTSDDYYGFLTTSEGYWGEGTANTSPQFYDDASIDLHTVDIGIGRLPVRTLAEAAQVVDKIIRYARGGTAGISDAGAWRNQLLFVGDYKAGEGSLHVYQADTLARLAAQQGPCFAQRKLYLDQYPAQNAGSIPFFPAAREQLLRSLNAGALIVNYTGHGNPSVLSNAQVFKLADVPTLSNAGRMPFWVTATCEFGRWDDPDETSAAEALLARPDGGAIGLLTSVRLVYSFPNFIFNRNWYDYSLTYDTGLGRYYTLGEQYRLTKNASYPDAPINTRNFALLADPGLTLAYPVHNVALTHINNQPVGDDTLKALGSVTLTGEVQTQSGALLAGYAGTVVVTVYDKTLPLRTQLSAFDYSEYRTVLYTGVAQVLGGRFTAQFVVPLDIGYSIGPGNIVFYTSSTRADGAGCYRQAIVCCTAAGAQQPNDPPSVQLYLNSENWQRGGTTDESPLLLAHLADDLGINTSGLGVGRELLAVLDDDETNATVLNEFYAPEAAASGSVGSISYRLQNLAEGHHRLRLRVWDVTNQSATAETEFLVAGSATLALDGLMNYPNPFNTETTVQFYTNQLNQPLELNLRIYGADGRLVLDTRQAYTADANRVELPLRLPNAKGVYVYEVILRNAATGAVVTKRNRMVVVP